MNEEIQTNLNILIKPLIDNFISTTDLKIQFASINCLSEILMMIKNKNTQSNFVNQIEINIGTMILVKI